jgi:CopG family transcriptional regulator, nickel-responsive regulator
MSLTRFGVSMEEELAELLDGLVRNEGYANRSEAIRSLIRKEIVRSVPENDTRDVAGIITLIYRYGKKLREVSTATCPSVRIMANLQLHLHKDVCQKIIVVQGAGADVTGWARDVVAQKGVVGKLTVVATEEIYHYLDPEHHENPELSLVLTRAEAELFRSTGKWLHPLFELERFLKNTGTDPKDCVLYDKVIGRASALLICRLGFTQVHTDLLSRKAEEVFKAAGIEFSATELVARILCKTEDMLADIDDPEEAYRIVTELAEKSRNRAGAGHGPVSAR